MSMFKIFVGTETLKITIAYRLSDYRFGKPGGLIAPLGQLLWKSNFESIHTEAHQGSTFGTNIFFLPIIGLTKTSETAHITMFADDTKCLRCYKKWKLKISLQS